MQLLVYDKAEGRRDFMVADHLPNVGKCDHSYLHHIVTCYDRLADWTVFSPDGPHDHLRGRTMADALIPGERLKVPYLHRGRDWGPDGRLRWKDLFFQIPHRDGKSWGQRYADGEIAPCSLSFVEWAKKYVGHDPDGPDWPGYQPGGILAVPRKAITYLPCEFYARLRDQLSHHREPEEGHYCERAWVVIFTGLARMTP